MFIDLTLEVTPKLTQDAKGNESKANLSEYILIGLQLICKDSLKTNLVIKKQSII